MTLDLADLAARVPDPDPAAATAARERQGRLTKPTGALGRLEELSVWLAAAQGQCPPGPRSDPVSSSSRRTMGSPAPGCRRTRRR